MSARSPAFRCNFEHLSVAMLHAKKNHLLDDEELMRLDTCKELHGRSSPRFIDWIPSRTVVRVQDGFACTDSWGKSGRSP